MGNRYYRSGQERGRAVASLFDTVASRYDLLNDLQSMGLHRRWKRRLVRRAGLLKGRLALDVCCGTGDLAYGLSRAGARVVGVDFSERMLRVTLGRSGWGSVGEPLFVRGDALRLPMAAGVYDLVTMGYGLRNLESFEGGLRECWRVTRPGGCLLLLDFGKPTNRWLRAFYFGYLRFVVPWFGWWACGDADSYGYILESLRHYPGREDLERLLVECGWVRVETEDLLGGTMSLTQAFKPGPES
jgi:demethylmenaquinone methyltransferase / 2-methoxy-6-polyprenyl-1,4-benzoquinol methylase